VGSVWRRCGECVEERGVGVCGGEWCGECVEESVVGSVWRRVVWGVCGEIQCGVGRWCGEIVWGCDVGRWGGGVHGECVIVWGAVCGGGTCIESGMGSAEGVRRRDFTCVCVCMCVCVRMLCVCRCVGCVCVCMCVCSYVVCVCMVHRGVCV